jgi:CrcB protein
MVSSLGALFVGGTTGVFARYAIGSVVGRAWNGSLPLGTLVVNLTGCFLIGLFDGLIRNKGFAGANARMLLLAGFCGAYTTFSSLILEFDVLLRTAPFKAMAYVLMSLSLGYISLRLGLVLGGS